MFLDKQEHVLNLCSISVNFVFGVFIGAYVAPSLDTAPPAMCQSHQYINFQWLNSWDVWDLSQNFHPKRFVNSNLYIYISFPAPPPKKELMNLSNSERHSFDVFFLRRFVPRGSLVWRMGHCVAGRLSSTFGVPRPAAHLRIGSEQWWDGRRENLGGSLFVGEVPKYTYTNFKSGWSVFLSRKQYRCEKNLTILWSSELFFLGVSSA